MAAYKAERGDIGLAVVLIGEDPASQVYVRNKIKACEEVGIKSFSYHLPAETSQAEAEALVDELVASDKVHGILVQLPLPKHLNEQKDIGAHTRRERCGRVLCGKRGQPCDEPRNHRRLHALRRYEDCSKSTASIRKARSAVVLGRSNIVGKPMAMLLLNADATVTVCHSKTKDLKEVCAGADILVVAIGRAKFVTADMVKEGAVVIDVGMDRDENGKLCGDVDFENVKDKAAYITPVPGGVGPMTITMLMYNTYIAASRR